MALDLTKYLRYEAVIISVQGTEFNFVVKYLPRRLSSIWSKTAPLTRYPTRNQQWIIEREQTLQVWMCCENLAKLSHLCTTEQLYKRFLSKHLKQTILHDLVVLNDFSVRLILFMLNNWKLSFCSLRVKHSSLDECWINNVKNQLPLNLFAYFGSPISFNQWATSSAFQSI